MNKTYVYGSVAYTQPQLRKKTKKKKKQRKKYNRHIHTEWCVRVYKARESVNRYMRRNDQHRKVHLCCWFYFSVWRSIVWSGLCSTLVFLFKNHLLFNITHILYVLKFVIVVVVVVRVVIVAVVVVLFFSVQFLFGGWLYGWKILHTNTQLVTNKNKIIGTYCVRIRWNEVSFSHCLSALKPNSSTRATVTAREKKRNGNRK